MHESDYITAVNKLLPPEMIKWKVHDAFTAGVPDAYYSGNSGDLWVEFKLLRNTPKKHTPKLSPLQKHWLRRQYEFGRQVTVIVGIKGGKGYILENLTWERQVEFGTPLTKRQIAEWIIKHTHS